ncbi:MAG: glycosyltransferase family 2 protein [Deltaproteobacteria bacterium]|nr:glycosyltransferase family 2 protein [Deltaproteobacteria bacterium]
MLEKQGSDCYVVAMEFSIVIPCLNEAETLARCIEKARVFINSHHCEAEIIIADNGSTDGSIQIAQKSGARVVPVAVKGYGAALMGGIEAARGRYIIMGDADDSYHFDEIMPFLDKLRAGFDLVMGCRFPRGGGRIMPGAMPWKHKWIGNPILTTIGQIFFTSKVKDFHCGLRAFTKEAFSRLNLRTTGMEFASEMVLKATLYNLKIAEVPVTLYKDGRSRPPHLRSFRDGWRHLRFMLMCSPGWLFFLPGFLLLFLGLITGGVLLFSSVKIFGLGFDTNTLLVSSMCIILGFQMLVFASFAKIFAISEGLLPKIELLNRAAKWVTLEVGILLGLFVLLSGLILMGRGVYVWWLNNFGRMPYAEGLRIVIPSITMMILGVQMIFSSFFMSLLSLSRKTG